MTIGNYAPPEETTEKPKAPSTPIGAVAQGIEEDLAHDVKETKVQAEKAKTYLEILKDNNIEVTDAQAIVDDMMTKGYYTENVQITKKISTTFRTRNHNDYLRYHTALQILNPKYRQEEDEIALRYCLAGSLVRFNATTFTHTAPTAPEDQMREAFDNRLEWIEKQPERLTALLAVKLNRFDQKIAIVMSEGVIENF
jgi:hypothetical protein